MLATARREAQAQSRRPVVAIVADVGGTELTDFVVPHAVLSESGAASVITVAAKVAPVRLVMSTMTIQPDLTFAAFDEKYPTGADYVVMPAIVDRASPAVTAWLRRQATHGATIVSICEGAWTVAEAGLLDGRRATSHWHALDALAKKYPHTNWIRDQRYVIDERLITTTGVTASLPVSLLLVERIAGRAAADSMARRLGIASWEPSHRTSDFHLTRTMYAKAVVNHFAWWRHDLVGVPVSDGVDEIALALTLDAIPRTMLGEGFTWSIDGGSIIGRQGLRMSVDRSIATRPAEFRELRLPPRDTPSTVALDSAIARLTAWYGDAAELIAMGMEYPSHEQH